MRTLLVVTLLIYSISSQAQFSPAPATFQGVWDGQSILGDLDNDGDLDIIISGSSGMLTTNSWVYRNDGSGSYSVVRVLPGIDGGSIDLGDFDQDGLLDILIVGGIENSSSVGTLLFRNKGSFIFEKIDHNLPPTNWGVGQFGDFDNDGDADILLVGADLANSYHDIYINNGGAFTPLGLTLPAYNSPSVSVGDYDLDSDLDYVIVGSGNAAPPTIFKNEGDHTFVPQVIYPNPIAYGDIEWGDFNSDGYLDVLLMGFDETLMSDQLAVLEHVGNDQFIPVTDTFDELSEGNGVWGDLDNDGDLDMVVTGHKLTDFNNATTDIYFNINGTFVKQAGGLPGLGFSHVALGDADNDLDLDIMLTGSMLNSQFLNGQSILYSNTIAAINTKPTPPSSLLENVEGQRAMLSWAQSADGQTSQGGLTYNIYISHLPSQDNSGFTLSDQATGFRKVVKTGNTQHNTSWLFDNLEPGTYYWGVQALDAGYVGSAFSMEKSFVVGNFSPELLSFSPTSGKVNSYIVIKGKNFIGTTSVKIHGTESVFHIINSTTLRVVVPNINGAGDIEITSPAGTGTSAESFCVIPEKPSLSGNTNVCPGIESYYVNSVAGIVYNWTVESGGEIVENNNNEVKIKWKSKGDYVVRVTPQTCEAGPESTLTVRVKGPAWKNIFGDATAKTETFDQYWVSYVPGESYAWALSRNGEIIGSSSTSDFLMKWTQPGEYFLKLRTSNAECATSPIEEILEINVEVNLFSNHSQLPFPSNKTISLVDLDNDGDHDFITNGSKIFENITPNGFQEKATSLRAFKNIRFADTDGDKDTDILLTYSNGSHFDIAELDNLGDFNFVTARIVGSKVSSTEADYIDYDNDGDLDILSLGTGGISIYERVTPSTFRLVDVYSDIETGKLSGSVRVTDFNNDGMQDIVTSSGGVFLNTGAKSFTSKQIIYPETFTGKIVWEDFDHDGDLDLGHVTYNKLDLYKNWDGSFTKFYSLASFFGSIQFVDVSGDGWKDLIIEEIPTHVCLYDATNHTFTNPLQTFDAWTNLSNQGSRLLGVTDVNLDGKNDLLLSCSNSSLIIYTNNTGNTFSPSFTQSLSSAINGNKAVLSWQGDAANTFEVAVGSSPGLTNVVATHSDLATGYRKVAKPGNAGNNTFFKIDELSPGTYYWSVQTIDNRQMGSPFSPWHSFTISPPKLPEPDSLRVFSTSTGIALRWQDNSDNEQGFVIERSEGDVSNFVLMGTVPGNTTDFSDGGIQPGVYYYYRIKAFNSEGESYYSKITSTQNSVVSTFPYFESFEESAKGWYQLERGEEASINAFATSANWEKYNFIFGSVDGNYGLRLSNGSSGLDLIAGVESPYFDMSRMINPCLVFDVSAKIDLNDPTAAIKIYASTDYEQSWKYVQGVGGGNDLKWYRQQVALAGYKSGISKLRIVGTIPRKSNQLFYFDDVRIVECPTNPGNPQVSQTGTTQLLLTWNESANASQYFLERREDSGSYKPIDTLDAPATSYLDKDLVPGKTYRYRIYAVNYEGPAYSSYVNFSAKYLTKPPVIQPIPDQEMKAMTTLSVEAAITDETAVGLLDIVVESSNPDLLAPDGLVVEKKSGSIVIKAISTTEDRGTVQVTISVKDEYYTVVRVFNLTIKDKNVAPVITSQRDSYTINEDATFEFSLNQLVVEDGDNNIASLMVNISTGDNYLVSGNRIIPTRDFNGMLSIPVTAGDGIDNSEVFQFVLNVTPVNDAPVITGTTLSADFTEDEPISIPLESLEVEDPDNTFPDNFSLLISPGQNYTLQGNVITLAENFYGNVTVPVQAFDGVALSNIYELKLNVLPVNDSPAITKVTKSLTFQEDEKIMIPLDAFDIVDPDNILSEFSIIPADGLNYEIVDGYIIPNEDFNGILTIPVRVYDGINVSEGFDLEVTIDTVNDVPKVLNASKPLSVAEDHEFSIPFSSLEIVDPDNTPVDFSVIVSEGMNYETRDGNIIPSKDFNGTLTVEARIFDGIGYSVPFEFDVIVTPVNDAPLLKNVKQPISASEDHEFSIPIELFEVSDPDNTFPNDFSLVINDGNNFIIRDGYVVPNENFHGTLIIPVQLTDGVTVSNVYDLQVTVLPVNDLPEIQGVVRTLTLLEDTNIIISIDNLIVKDPDNSISDLNLTILEGLHYSSTASSLVPENNYYGELSVPVSVDDGYNDSEIVMIPVYVLPVNDAPIITGIKNEFITTENVPSEINLTDLDVIDVDNIFPIDHNLIVLEGENYKIDGNTILPVQDFFGSLNVTVQVSDGNHLSEKYQIDITVGHIVETEENKSNDVILYPNPNRGKFKFTLSTSADPFAIRILDSAGHVVYRHEGVQQREIELDLQIPSGMYFLETRSENNKVIKKFIVN